MVSQSKASMQTNFKVLIDVIVINLGVLFGGIIALVSLWLWRDYRINPTDSYLALISTQLVATLPTPIRGFLDAQAQLMDLPLTGQTSAFWYMARAGGIVAYLVLWLSTIWGLMLSTKVMASLIPAPIAYGLHEFLSILTILFALLHSIVLLGDEYVKFSMIHLAIPFIAPYRPFWTGFGTIGLYMSAVITGSFYIRKLIGQKTWRILHYLTFVVYLLVLIHALMAGTDSPSAELRLMYLATGSSVLFLVYYRLFSLKVSSKTKYRV